MKIKTFRAQTFAEALAMVKKELSEHAVILSTEELGGARRGVEVTAAVDYDLAECPASGTGSMWSAEGGIEEPDLKPNSPSAVPLQPRQNVAASSDGGMVAENARFWREKVLRGA